MSRRFWPLQDLLILAAIVAACAWFAWFTATIGGAR